MNSHRYLVTDFLVHSFVEDYEYNRGYVNHLNRELEDLRIPYKYTYDEFCIELMDRFLDIVERICHTFSEVYDRFSDLVYRAIRDMKRNKVQLVSSITMNEW